MAGWERLNLHSDISRHGVEIEHRYLHLPNNTVIRNRFDREEWSYRFSIERKVVHETLLDNLRKNKEVSNIYFDMKIVDVDLE